MWKIFLEYSDKSKCTLTGKHKEIPLELAKKYYNEYGVHAEKAIYQQYPKKDNGPMELLDKIKELEGERKQLGRVLPILFNTDMVRGEALISRAKTC